MHDAVRVRDRERSEHLVGNARELRPRQLAILDATAEILALQVLHHHRG